MNLTCYLICATITLMVCQNCLAVQEEEHHGHGSKHVQSDKHHKTEDGEHNPHFDHEAILGSKELEEEFDTLEPEEAKKRLRILFKRMDSDNDGFVTKDELTQWVMMSFTKLDGEDSLEELKRADHNKDGKISWSEYVSETYGYNKEEMEDFEKLDQMDHDDFDQVIIDDKLKFTAADLDKDGHLSEEEYKAFTHPYDHKHMHEQELSRTKREYDHDKDGLISKEEYLKRDTLDAKEAEIYEHEQFKSYDKNSDGQLDDEEMVEWVLPSNREAATEEAEHLIDLADEDKDGKLTEEEMVEKHEGFVGSQATNYGHYLPKDEL